MTSTSSQPPATLRSPPPTPAMVDGFLVVWRERDAMLAEKIRAALGPREEKVS